MVLMGLYLDLLCKHTPSHMTHIALLHLAMTYVFKKKKSNEGVKLSRADLLYCELHITGVLLIYEIKLKSHKVTLLKLA